MGCFIATPCLYVSEREIPCLFVSEREIYDLLFTFAILHMVARYSLPHMLKSLHRLAIAIIMDSTNEEWVIEIDVELIKFIKKCQIKKAEASDRHNNGF